MRPHHTHPSTRSTKTTSSCGPSDDATKQVVYRTAGEIDVYALENLAQAVGWPKRPVDKVEQALKHSFLVAALHLETIDESGAPIEEESELIGLARATSDHVFNATIWDVLVDPKWQGNGFGTALVERTVNNASPKGHCEHLALC